MKFNVKSEPV